METLDDYNDKCPEHGTPERQSYDFGRYRDATVTVFGGCPCAVVHLSSESTIDGRERFVHCKNYREASGLARLQVAVTTDRLCG